MNYWLHRSNYEWEISYPLFENGYLTYGWRGYLEHNVEKMIEEDQINGFEKFVKLCNIETQKNRYCLERFIKMKKGDIVVVPRYNGEFAICEIEEESKPISCLAEIPDFELKNKNGKTVIVDENGIHNPSGGYYDIGHIIKIKTLNIIPRSFASAPLISRMKIRQANANINDLKDDIETAKNTKEPISLHGEFHKSLQPQIKQVFQKYVTPDNFEKVVKWYMEKQGATHVYIPAKNEKGKSEYADADIIAEFEELKLIFYIQAKKHSGESGDWAVTQISRYKEQMADSDSDYTYVLWVVSSADDFSGEAKLQAQANNVRLINGDEFYSMILNAGISNMNF